ncbi:MAG: hypothetical protein SGPRY_012851 [Prymnesium sp.]
MTKFEKTRLGKKGIKKRIQKQKAKKQAKLMARAESSEQESDTPRSLEAAMEYLKEWTARHEGSESSWKFNKTRQVFLLKAWPDRSRLPAEAFKQLLVYMTSLPDSLQQRTVEQAQKEAEEAERAQEEAEVQLAAVSEEGDENEGEEMADELNERLAIFKIRRARALKVIQTLTTGAQETR